TVSGEEKGLLGSEFYTNHPVYPLENTVTNLNIDMVGRVGTNYQNSPDSANYVYIIGSDKLSSELHAISEKANEDFTNMVLDYKYNDDKDPNRFYYRSDHYNFAKNGIPIIFYFNGTHPDYHQPTDTEEKINYDKMLQTTKLVWHTAWVIANRTERPVVDKAESGQ
ncbi:MAG: M28 family peptidase, partial [Bacteroidota bacterium]